MRERGGKARRARLSTNAALDATHSVTPRRTVSLVRDIVAVALARRLPYCDAVLSLAPVRLVHMKGHPLNFVLVTRAALAIAAAIVVSGPASALVKFDIRYESDTPGMQHTTATFSVGGVETFETHGTGNSVSFITDFGTAGAITGSYAHVQIIGADQYGASGGTGLYPVAFRDTPYSLTLTSTIPGGVNYFGYWLSALDAGNTVSFYSGGTLLFVFDPSDVLAAVNAAPVPSAYYGNPTAPFHGQNGGEPYVFLNFFNDNGSFDRIDFSENPNFGGGYESDNHTVGHFLTKGTGTVVPQANAVPEPASWAMMITGFALVGLMVRARRARGPQVSA
jgi:hypothetical protein